MSDIFLKKVKECFGFLIEQYGFSIIAEESKMISYASKKVWVEIYFDSEKTDFDLGFGRVGHEEDRSMNFQIEDLKQFKGLKRNDQEIIVENDDDLKRLINEYSQDLKRYGEEALAGHDDFYESLKRQCAEEEKQAIQKSNVISKMYQQKKQN